MPENRDRNGRWVSYHPCHGLIGRESTWNGDEDGECRWFEWVKGEVKSADVGGPKLSGGTRSRRWAYVVDGNAHVGVRKTFLRRIAYSGSLALKTYIRGN